MPRKHPRRSKGQRPPRSGRVRPGAPAPPGFTGPGFRQLYRRLLPGLEGPAKRYYFNELSTSIVAVVGLAGALLGFGILGWPGGLLGLALGVWAGGLLVEDQRFFRR